MTKQNKEKIEKIFRDYYRESIIEMVGAILVLILCGTIIVSFWPLIK